MTEGLSLEPCAEKQEDFRQLLQGWMWADLEALVLGILRPTAPGSRVPQLVQAMFLVIFGLLLGIQKSSLSLKIALETVTSRRKGGIVGKNQSLGGFNITCLTLEFPRYKCVFCFCHFYIIGSEGI